MTVLNAPTAITIEQAKNAVLAILDVEEAPARPQYGPNDAVSPQFTTPYPPDVEDLARLYRTVRSRRVTTILEFGSGYSTSVMACALAENRRDFAEDPQFKKLRRNNPFELHSIDCSADWLKLTQGRVPSHVRDLCRFHHSSSSIGTFNGRLCHYYDSLPNVCPDFIYLDAPFQFDVSGNVGGIHFRHEDRTVLAADIARMEWMLLPGCYVLVDGRTNNARFLKANFQRSWRHVHEAEGDVHMFELVEAPLGGLNRAQLRFCLGQGALDAYEQAGQDGSV